jgi:hypothetical protein
MTLRPIAKETGMVLLNTRAPLVNNLGVRANTLALFRVVSRGMGSLFGSVNSCLRRIALTSRTDMIITHDVVLGLVTAAL